jgi:hypothetical protein
MGAVKKYIRQEKIEAGFQAFTSDGSEEFGAVRQVSPGGRAELVIYVENAGDFTVPLSAVDAVHSEKVILNCGKLDSRLRHATATHTMVKSQAPEEVGKLPQIVEGEFAA